MMESLTGLPDVTYLPTHCSGVICEIMCDIMLSCTLIGLDHHQQRSRKLCLSVRTIVSKRLEEHHWHRPERNCLRHPGAGEETDPEPERSKSDPHPDSVGTRMNLHSASSSTFNRRLLSRHHYHLRRVRVWFRCSECIGQGWSGGALQVSPEDFITSEFWSNRSLIWTRMTLYVCQVSGCRVGALWPQVQHHPTWTNQNQGWCLLRSSLSFFVHTSLHQLVCVVFRVPSVDWTPLVDLKKPWLIESRQVVWANRRRLPIWRRTLAATTPPGCLEL